MPAMIYHAPYTLNRKASSASGIRPVQMRDAFEANGYEILEVTGSPAQRRAAIKAVRRYLKSGKSIDFLYSESATIPTMFAGDKHFPPHPFLDVALFKMCKKWGIPTALFYRDIYWVFDSYTERVNPVIARIMQRVYRYDLRWYSRYVDVLYLPSEKMADYVPIFPQERIRVLPPGSFIKDPVKSAHDGINLLYIGGLGDHYKLHEAVKAVAATEEITMTICTREREWEAAREQYEPLMDDSIQVVHRSGEGLTDLYAQADICSLFVMPGEYWSFAAPVKLYEYLGFGVPVIASSGTYAADFVEEHNCGWSIQYSDTSLRELLHELKTNPEKLEAIMRQVREIRKSHTWLARAKKVAQDTALTKVHG